MGRNGRLTKDGGAALPPLIASHGLIHGLSASIPALLPLIMKEFNLNYTEVGILAFSLGASIGIMSITTGIISDIVRDKLLILGYTLLLTGVFSVSVVFMQNYVALLIFMVVLGVLLSFYHPLALSYIAMRFCEKRGRVFGIHEIGANIGLASAPAIAGFLAPIIGWRLSFAILAMPSVIFALLVLKMESIKATSKTTSISSSTADCNADHCHYEMNTTHERAIHEKICEELRAFMHQMKDYTLRRLYIAEGIFGFVVGGASTFIPLYLVAEGFSVSFAGLMTGMFLAFGAVGKYLGGVMSDIFGGRSAVSAGFLVASPLFFAVPLVSSAPISLVLLIIAGMTFPMALSAIIAGISEQVHPSRTGIAFGFMMLAGFGFGSLSRPILGYASDMLGISSIFFIISAVSLIGGIIIARA